VECALKACIAKAIAGHQFPDKSIAEKAWKHSAVDLIQVPGRKVVLDKDNISDPTLKALADESDSQGMGGTSEPYAQAQA
jgi:hypothetical protein